MDKLAQWIAKGRVALLAVDVQNDYCHEKGAGAQMGSDVSMAQEAARHLDAVLAQARALALPVIHVRTTHGPWTDSPAWSARRSAQAPPLCVDGTWGAEFYGAGAQPGDRVITKHRYSGFINTELDTTLHALGSTVLLVGGVSTNVCVESTVRHAFMLDYYTVTLSDCCGAYTRAEHEASLHNLGKHFGMVADSQAVLARLAAARSAAS